MYVQSCTISLYIYKSSSNLFSMLRFYVSEGIHSMLDCDNKIELQNVIVTDGCVHKLIAILQKTMVRI